MPGTCYPDIVIIKDSSDGHMVLAAISNTLTYAEPFLWLLAFIAFLRTKNHSSFPALRIFLGIRVVSTFLLSGIYRAHDLAPSVDGHLLYTYIYWGSYFIGLVALFFSLQELFRYIMSSLPGLSRLGIACFRWAALASLIVAGATIFTLLPEIPKNIHLSFVLTAFARCLCILELCLLAFLAVSLHALGHTYRSRVSGIALGFSMMAVMDLLVFSLRFSQMSAWPNQVAETVTTLALLTWLAYFVLPEPVRQAVALPAASPLLRWNDLALAIGHSTPPVAVEQTGFLQNVESVVDRVLTKNSLNTAG